MSSYQPSPVGTMGIERAGSCPSRVSTAMSPQFGAHNRKRTPPPGTTSAPCGIGPTTARLVDAGGMTDQRLVEADHLDVVFDRDALIGPMETRQILRPRAYRGESVHVLGHSGHV